MSNQTKPIGASTPNKWSKLLVAGIVTRQTRGTREEMLKDTYHISASAIVLELSVANVVVTGLGTDGELEWGNPSGLCLRRNRFRKRVHTVINKKCSLSIYYLFPAPIWKFIRWWSGHCRAGRYSIWAFALLFIRSIFLFNDCLKASASDIFSEYSEIYLTPLACKTPSKQAQRQTENCKTIVVGLHHTVVSRTLNIPEKPTEIYNLIFGRYMCRVGPIHFLQPDSCRIQLPVWDSSILYVRRHLTLWCIRAKLHTYTGT
jgi:hypothetical protein